MTVRDLVQMLMKHPLSMPVCVSPDTFNAWDAFHTTQTCVRGEQTLVLIPDRPSGKTDNQAA